MSLINQVLKDLEKRRAAVSSPDVPLAGVNRYSVARRRPPVLLYGVITLLLVLIALVGFLGWVYLDSSPSADAESARGATAPIQEPRVEAGPLVPAAPQIARRDPEPVAESPGKARPAKTREDTPPEKATPEKASPEKTAPEKAETQDATKDDHGGSDPVTAEEENNEPVNKRNRPLSDEQRAELAYKKGYTLLSREQTESGMRQLREALAHYRRHHRARELLASVYIKSGRYVEAAALLKEGVALAPENHAFAKLYARVLIQQEKPEQAVAVLEHRPPSPGADSEYHALLAAVYQQAGQYLKAAASYRDVLRIDPRQGNWWIGLGVSLEQLGKYDEARSAYQRAKNSANLSEDFKQYVDKRLAALADGGS